MKPEREPMLPIVCPDCKRRMDVAITKLANAVGVVCIGCRKEIRVTPALREAMQGVK